MGDEAFATPVVMVRPATIEVGTPRPRPAIVVRFPGGAALRELILKGLLRRRWSLVAPPAGEYEFGTGPRARVYLGADQLRIVANGETVFDGRLSLDSGAAGSGWNELARACGEVLVCVTAGDKPILTDEDVDFVARQGYLVGIVGDVR